MISPAHSYKNLSVGRLNRQDVALLPLFSSNLAPTPISPLSPALPDMSTMLLSPSEPCPPFFHDSDSSRWLADSPRQSKRQISKARSPAPSQSELLYSNARADANANAHREYIHSAPDSPDTDRLRRMHVGHSAHGATIPEAVTPNLVPQHPTPESPRALGNVRMTSHRLRDASDSHMAEDYARPIAPEHPNERSPDNLKSQRYRIRPLSRSRERPSPYERPQHLAGARYDTSDESSGSISVHPLGSPFSATSYGDGDYPRRRHSAVQAANAQRPVTRIPKKLPPPNIHVLSDPYKDLAAHLRRHGLLAEANTFAHAGVPVDYVLHGYISTAYGGPPALLEQTGKLLTRQPEEVSRQMSRSRVDDPRTASEQLPECLTFDVEMLDVEADAHGLIPTHVFAVTPSILSEQGINNGILMPIHAMPYVLQCVSLPPLPATTAPDARVTGTREIPVVSLKVPDPQNFFITHRFVYNHDNTELLCQLLPMRYITSTLNREVTPDLVSPTYGPEASTSSSAAASSQRPPRNFTTARAINVLSKLSPGELFKHCRLVHSAWGNGVAIGLMSDVYWSTLDRAWDILIAALMLQRGRHVVEDEMARMMLRGDLDDTPRSTSRATFSGPRSTLFHPSSQSRSHSQQGSAKVPQLKDEPAEDDMALEGGRATKEAAEDSEDEVEE